MRVYYARVLLYDKMIHKTRERAGWSIKNREMEICDNGSAVHVGITRILKLVIGSMVMS